MRLRAKRFPPVYMAAGKKEDPRLRLVFANSVVYTSSNTIFYLRFIGTIIPSQQSRKVYANKA